MVLDMFQCTMICDTESAYFTFDKSGRESKREHNGEVNLNYDVSIDWNFEKNTNPLYSIFVIIYRMSVYMKEI